MSLGLDGGTEGNGAEDEEGHPKAESRRGRGGHCRGGRYYRVGIHCRLWLSGSLRVWVCENILRYVACGAIVRQVGGCEYVVTPA
mmetsp:Transcript_5824/g.11662  ORF Transcript_5824/g.11662 Transcript_5824/m.11662 type:complete len:85 (-) Transcript_5824:38-292(-)